MIIGSTVTYFGVFVLGLILIVFGTIFFLAGIANGIKELELTDLGKIVLGCIIFTLGSFLTLSSANNIGMIRFHGKPIHFTELRQNNSYQIIKILDTNLVLLKEKGSDDVRIVEDLSKEVLALGEGTTFELKDVPAITTEGKFIAPMMLHPH